MKGCEAWNALCGAASAVEQCSSPGPVVALPTTALAKEGLEVRPTHQSWGPTNYNALVLPGEVSQ